ncbi:bifunctional hydroxymethylpyrimidine kinase/phosphomethylpyrimidine kinase [Brachybacterium endophyticum]|uniref:bifunctional hydroxymethylpyrimidine kinase/phosphomethylpyrimidine kinase n=1 Tax=Brachybacterium endophyticum TaxID=2182385 RepID=UPI00196B2DED|nr:bifunctional hydroxymethylpyrimidine kinase/phosphomethylpyrimidine kinase [Brachybacterium endophyticum]
MSTSAHPIPNILSIAGTDPTGGAGIQADLKAISAQGAFAMAVVTAVVAQNTQGVRGVRAMDPEFVGEQIDAVFEDVRVDAVKIGMVANAGIAEVIADRLAHHGADRVVLDPVMVAKSGDRLLDEDAVDAVRDLLVPRSSIITPNLPEAAVLLGEEPDWDLSEMRRRAPALLELGPSRVLLKGGHLDGSATSTDLLCGPEGILELPAPRIATTNDHGTGCTLSAAIAALLPQRSAVDAVREGKAYLHDALAASDRLDVGRGHGPLHHFHALWEAAGIDR